jgi:uncharacterized protein (TIGR02757 family)
MNLSFDELKDLLESKYYQYNQSEFIETDPIQIPHLFTKKQDIEIAGFLAATLAWGQRATILRNANKLMEWMDHSPFDFILNFESEDLNQFNTFKHRTFNGEDCRYFLMALQNIYKEFDSMENSFVSGSPDLNIPEMISDFKKLFFSISHQQRTEKHLADPMKGSAAKRINMFLRWMVRNDQFGVDFGIWEKISPSKLYCPLDVHSGNVARKLGLLSRNQSDWKAVEELTTQLRKFDSKDPVKYDFALFGLGVFEKF